jgi:hypothetical protein
LGGGRGCIRVRMTCRGLLIVRVLGRGGGRS